MKKRIFSILTALALCLTLLPAAAWAAEQTYDLWQVTEGERTELYYGTYDPDN